MSTPPEVPDDPKVNSDPFQLIIWSILSINFALLGQLVFIAKSISNLVGMLFFAISIPMFLWTLVQSPQKDLETPKKSAHTHHNYPIIGDIYLRIFLIFACVIMIGVAFLGFGGNDFSGGFIAWSFSIIFFLLASVEIPDIDRVHWKQAIKACWLKIDKRVLVILMAIVLLAIFFRVFRLNSIPGEMTSDHAEKLLDVQDVLDGKRPVFFGRNTGREAFQFYLTAFLIRFTPLSISHLALQVGTAIFGVLAVPFTFLLGKELYGREVGLVAAFFLAISHWHVTITRVGLRFPFTAAFATPAIFFLLRAFKSNHRNDWLAAAFFLGLGLHTYTPMRIVPVIFLILIIIKYFLDRANKLNDNPPERPVALERRFWFNALLGGFFTLLLFLPLFRYMIDDPVSFWSRSISRLNMDTGNSAVYLFQNFFINIKNALLMFNYRGDVVPINTIPEFPVLGVVNGALFVLGCAYLFWKLFKDKDRRSLFLILILFFLLMPSILSLSFPQENPSVARTGGAVSVVMIVSAIPFTISLRNGDSRSRRVVGILMLMVLVAIALIYNYFYYFEWYARHAQRSLWNATQMGEVLNDFQISGGELNNAYHVPYPHWVDTRNIGINLGDVTWANVFDDNANLEEHAAGERPRIYLLFPEDEPRKRLLAQLFPDGHEEIYNSQREGKNFIIFRVP